MGGGGGSSGSSRNDVSLGDRDLSGIPWPVSQAGMNASGFIPGASPGTDPFGFNPGGGNPNIAETSASAFNNAVGGSSAFSNLGLGMLGSNMPGSDLSPYMNPFQQNVIDTTMSNLDRQKNFAAQGIEDSAFSSGAFGGSRHGVRESLLDRQYGDIEAQTLAGLNSQNFRNAQGQQQFFASLGADLAPAGFNNLSSLSNMGFGMARGINQDQMLAGAMQQQMMQKLIDASKGQFGGYTGAGERSLAYQSELPPIGNAGTQTTTQPGYNPMGDILGLAGMFAMSDVRLKENIRKVGKTDGGYNVYTYNFIDDPNKVSYMGVMAQEVNSDAVVELKNGLLAVDYSKVM